jgi:hypothetical protein
MIARAILVLVAVAMIATGVAFCGVAINLLLIPLTGEPAAAALTALALFLTVGAGAIVYLAVSRSHPVVNSPLHAANAQPQQSQEALVTALAQMAKEHPLLAVACSATLGLADAMKRRER